MKFDLLTGGQEIKLAILVKFCFSGHYFVCLVHISLLLSLLAMVSSNFKIKQTPGHNHENTIFQLEQWSFNDSPEYGMILQPFARRLSLRLGKPWSVV